MNLADFRKQYPQYDDMSDQQLADSLHSKFYSDVPKDQFYTQIGHSSIPDEGATSAFYDKAKGMATFGIDKPAQAALAAGEMSLAGRGDYGDLFDKAMVFQNNRDKAESENHPYASAAGNTVGFGASMLLPAGKIFEGAKTAAHPFLSSAAASAGIGGAVGGINEAANTPGSWQDKAQGFGSGAVKGEVLGAAIPAVGQGLVTAGNKAIAPVIEYFTTTEGQRALQKIGRAMGRDNITPEQGAQILQQMGPDASIADVGGANMAKQGQVIASMPGKAAATQENFLLGRQSTMGKRLQTAIKTGFGNDAEFNDTIGNLQQAQQERAAPLYQKAYAKNQNIQSPAINRILETPAGQSALKTAAVKMQNDMSLMGVNDPDLVEQAQLAGQYQPGSGGIASGLKLRTHDYIKRAFDDQIGAAQRAGENDNVRILSGLKNNYIKALDAADATATKSKPGLYAQARAAYSGPAKSLEALDMGRNFMNEDSQTTANDVAGLSDADKYFFQIGASRAIGDKASSNPSNTIKNVVNNDLWKQKLQAAMPTEDHYYDFMQNAQNMLNMSRTKNAALGNSNTAGKLASMAEDEPSMPLDMNLGNLVDLSRGDWKGTAMQLGKMGWNKITSPSAGVRDEMANMLYSANPQQNYSTLQALKNLPIQQAQPFLISPYAAVPAWQASNEVSNLSQ